MITSDLQMASIFPNCVVDMAVVGACHVDKIFQMPKSYFFSVIGCEEVFDEKPVVSLVIRSLTLLSIPSPCVEADGG